MEGLVMAAQLIAALALLVIVHEFGHFIAARAFGIRVEKFYLFFDAGGFKFFNIRKGGTEYGIGWLPLGGYVKISGMIDESMDRDQMKKPPKPWEFRSRPSWQRLIVMVAGVVMNVILGIIIFSSMILFYNNHYISTNTVNKTGIYAYELGRKIGFRNGDKIISVSGDEVKRFQDVVSTDVLFGSNITVQRDGRLLNITVPD